GDPYLAAAGLSSLTRANLAAALEVVFAGSGDVPPSLAEDLLRTAMGFGDIRSTGRLLAYLTRPRPGGDGAAQFAAVAGGVGGAAGGARRSPPPSGGGSTRGTGATRLWRGWRKNGTTPCAPASNIWSGSSPRLAGSRRTNGRPWRTGPRRCGCWAAGATTPRKTGRPWRRSPLRSSPKRCRPPPSPR